MFHSLLVFNVGGQEKSKEVSALTDKRSASLSQGGDVALVG
jgi:hypothetical protein